MSEAHSSRPPLTPRYWPGWLAVGLLWLLGRTPQRFALLTSRFLSWPLRALLKRRRLVAERNIERCFPELDAGQRDVLVSRFFESLARMLFEVAWSWSASERFVRRVSEPRGKNYVQGAIAEGRGVLLLTGHFSCLEFGARIASLVFDRAGGLYRPLRNPVLEWYQNRSRGRYTERLIQKDDLREAVRFLRSGGVLWYAPDQDFGPKRSAFVPFFGISTATLTVTKRLVELTDCRVVPMFPAFDPGTRKYILTFCPPMENFPTDDDIADLSRFNELLEQHVRLAPEQYWWIHRRFKTRPPGEPPFYD